MAFLAHILRPGTLVEVGRLQKGEKVLIHAASGATGQLAIQVAKIIGAVIFVTVGFDHKKGPAYSVIYLFSVSQESYSCVMRCYVDAICITRAWTYRRSWGLWEERRHGNEVKHHVRQSE